MRRFIKKKILTQFADAILSGEKTFEIRENDEGYQKGDIIVFRVAKPDFLEADTSHPLNGREYEVTYVLSGWGLSDGYVALGIVPRLTEVEKGDRR